MSTTETIPCPDSDSASDHQVVKTAEAYTRAHPRAAREERHLAMLREMQDDNMCIQTLLRASAQAEARKQSIAEQNREEAPPSRLEAIGRAHANLVRATRLLMMTEIQIDDGRIARLEGNIGVVQADREQLKAEQDKAVREQSLRASYVEEHAMAVQDVMEEMIELTVEDDAERADLLLKSLYGRLDEISQEDDFEETCTGEIVAGLCKHLGIEPDWDDWADQEWAKDEAECEMEGSPYCPQPRVVRDEDGRYRFSSMKVAAKGTGPP